MIVPVSMFNDAGHCLVVAARASAEPQTVAVVVHL